MTKIQLGLENRMTSYGKITDCIQLPFVEYLPQKGIDEVTDQHV